jgi:hypothetical protein
LPDLLAYRANLFKYASYVQVGLLPAISGSFSIDLGDGDIVGNRSLNATTLPDELLAATIVRRRVGLYTLGSDAQPLPEALAGAYADLNLQLYDAAIPKVRAQLISSDVTLESCPTSNVLLGRMDDYVQHPITGFIRDGLRVTVSSDDPGIFGTTIEEEIRGVWSAMGEPGVGEGLADLKKLIHDSHALASPWLNEPQFDRVLATFK